MYPDILSISVAMYPYIIHVCVSLFIYACMYKLSKPSTYPSMLHVF